ncbi:MAG: hypothetical protein NZM12_01180, partial [Steroidobacteraceae bacterium]|nr:hypothetical protein [Steroidobacteraceae bacterium]
MPIAVRTLSLAVAAVLTAASCRTTTYTPQKVATDPILPSTREEQRISASAIRADLDWIESLQQRIKALNDAGRPVDDYHLARAQCWLSFGLEEYHENDRTGVIEAALAESLRIVTALERHATPAPTASPIATAVKLREDLWARLDALQKSPGFSCAAAQAACLEVVLNHAGHEFNETGWRHARGTIAEAERLAAEGEARAANCVAASAAVVRTEEQDDDRDGVPNREDRCPDTPPPARVDAQGCELTAEIRLPGVNFATASA